MKMKIMKVRDNAIIPTYATTGSVGMDLYSVDEFFMVPKGQALVHTGIAMEIPEGYEVQIRQRSGISVNFPNYIKIGVGTIDWDYRGEIIIPVKNNSDHDMFRILEGMRIAQAIVAPVVRVEIEEVKELSETGRASGGFGHTGD